MIDLVWNMKCVGSPKPSLMLRTRLCLYYVCTYVPFVLATCVCPALWSMLGLEAISQAFSQLDNWSRGSYDVSSRAVPPCMRPCLSACCSIAEPAAEGELSFWQSNRARSAITMASRTTIVTSAIPRSDVSC